MVEKMLADEKGQEFAKKDKLKELSDAHDKALPSLEDHKKQDDVLREAYNAIVEKVNDATIERRRHAATSDKFKELTAKISSLDEELGAAARKLNAHRRAKPEGKTFTGPHRFARLENIAQFMFKKAKFKGPISELTWKEREIHKEKYLAVEFPAPTKNACVYLWDDSTMESSSYEPHLDKFKLQFYPGAANDGGAGDKKEDPNHKVDKGLMK
jgi:hypothetical protein